MYTTEQVLVPVFAQELRFKNSVLHYRMNIISIACDQRNSFYLKY